MPRAAFVDLPLLRYSLDSGYGYEVVNTRGDLKIGLLPVAGSPPVEWSVTGGTVDYERALSS